MKTRLEFIVSVQHSNSIMMFTMRAVSRSQATQYSILKYPRANFIHVSDAI